MSVAKNLNKPQLRGLLHSQIKKDIIIATVLSIGAAVGLKVFVNDARKAAYAEYYKNYDLEADFHRMRNKGLLDSAEPDN